VIVDNALSFLFVGATRTAIVAGEKCFISQKFSIRTKVIYIFTSRGGDNFAVFPYHDLAANQECSLTGVEENWTIRA